ncbi:MAG: PduL/EutD family phosphate acyltransferase [bacterium]|nr:PduL/EutD family phosphate acyltransferase [bacterium]
MIKVKQKTISNGVKYKVIAEVSGRHLHISQSHLAKLFGKNYKLKAIKSLSQPGDFAAAEQVEILGPKNKLVMRIVGPVRKKTQIELAVSDCRYLGIEPAFRISGDLKKSPGALLKGPKGKIKLADGVIVPIRHLHLSELQAKKWKLKNGQKVKALVGGVRGMLIDQIVVRVGNYDMRIHLDTDEANAAGLLSCSKIDLIL